MPQPVDVTRRRIALAGLGAVLLIAAEHRTPTIGTIAIRIDERLVPEVAAAWSPPVARVLWGAGRVAAALGIVPGR